MTTNWNDLVETTIANVQTRLLESLRERHASQEVIDETLQLAESLTRAAMQRELEKLLCDVPVMH